MSASGEFAKLHHLHLRLDDQTRQLEGGPKRIRDAEAAISRKEQELAAAKLEQQNLQKSADQINLQFRTTEAKIGDLKGKLNAASNNVEFQILKKQVASETEATVALESQYLGKTEAIDTFKVKVAAITKELENTRENLKKVIADVAAKEPVLKKAIADLRSEISVVCVCIPEEHRDYYRRSTEKQGAEAFAAVEDGACVECSTELTPQKRQELGRDKLMMCQICGRFLYSA